MKLLFCQDCGSLTVPVPVAYEPSWCNCQRHAVWWEDTQKGILRVYDQYEATWMEQHQRPYPRNPRSYVIGLHNGLLRHQGQLDAKAIKELIEATPDTYMFKRVGSLVARFRPGETGDTGYAPLPKKANLSVEATSRK